MCDECTDVNNKEQLVLCLRWVEDDKLEVHEDFIGMYVVPNIAADILFSTIKDVLIRLNLSFTRCRGQCYDGANNMRGAKNGMSKQIMDIESRALYTHCYGHSLNLAAGDAIKGCKVLQDTLDITLEISRLIKFSPKRNNMFDILKDELAPETCGFRVLCPTRWTVRAESLNSVVTNYEVLLQLWEDCLETRLQSDIRARIIGVQSQMESYKYLYGVMLGLLILKHSDNLSRSLQKTDISASEGQEIASFTVKTLKLMRNEEHFRLFWLKVTQSAEKLNIQDAFLPRRIKKPKRYEDGICSEHSATPEEHYFKIYCQAMDLIINCIERRFNQPGYQIYKNLQELLLNSVNKKDFSKEFDVVIKTYGSDIDSFRLQAQLETLAAQFESNKVTRTFNDILCFLQHLSPVQRSIFCQI